MTSRMRTNRKTGGKFWISGAVKNPGSLRQYIHNTFGEEGFTAEGNIKPSIIDKLAAGKCPTCAGTPKTCVCPTKLTEQRARLAKRFREFRK